MRKRIISAVLAIALCLGLMAVPAAAGETAKVYVTIADAGELKVVHSALDVTDINGSGGLDIDDAMYAAHEKFYEGGAEAGYKSEVTQYGLSMVKLWGDASGSFGYYVNNASAWSLADSVKDGDSIVAFVYKDKTYFSDVYTYFNREAVSVSAGRSLTLSLSMNSYDENWNILALPAEGFTVTGGDSNAQVGKDGCVTLSFSKPGTYTVTAFSDSYTIVPPACVVTVTEASGEALPFKDVYESDGYYDAVKTLYESKIMVGTGADTFSPQGGVTRGMAVTVLGRLSGAEAGTGSAFTDVKANMYYSGYVAWAAENGIVNGYGGGKFGPEDGLQKYQLQLILQRYADFAGIEYTPDENAGTEPVTRAELAEAVVSIVSK